MGEDVCGRVIAGLCRTQAEISMDTMELLLKYPRLTHSCCGLPGTYEKDPYAKGSGGGGGSDNGMWSTNLDLHDWRNPE